jgi:hypothetical protein
MVAGALGAAGRGGSSIEAVCAEHKEAWQEQRQHARPGTCAIDFLAQRSGEFGKAPCAQRSPGTKSHKLPRYSYHRITVLLRREGLIRWAQPGRLGASLREAHKVIREFAAHGTGEDD